jgi:hypothetical protein
MALTKIVSRHDSSNVLFECDVPDGVESGLAMRHALEKAVEARADLSGADLSGADLGGAYLSGADLRGAKDADLAIAMTRITPEGSLIGWKRCQNGVIVKLRIPEEAKRSSAFGRKCRAEYADVLEVIGAEKGLSMHDARTEYVAGSRVMPDSFSDDWQEECAPGIHFFLTKLEAENYV